MKKIMYILRKKTAIVSFLCTMLMWMIPVMANEENNFTEGDYIITTEIKEEMPLERSSTKIGSKTYTYSTTAGEVLWKYTVYGKFSYDGKNAYCVQATDSCSIQASDWQLKSNSVKATGNQAVGTCSVNRIVLGVVNNNVVGQAILTCSPTGKLY